MSSASPVRLRTFVTCLLLYEFAVNSSNDTYLPALPQIGVEYAVEAAVMQRTITAWLAGAATLQLLLGPASDRWGRRFTLFFGGGVFCLATLGCALSSHVSMLMVARFFQGIGMCTLTVAGYATIHELFPAKRAVEIIGWMGTISILAPILGPTLGGLMLEQGSWRLGFWAVLGVALLGLLGLAWCMPETNVSPDARAMQWRPMLQTYLTIARSPTFAGVTVVYGMIYGGVMAWITASPYLLMEGYGLASVTFGFLQIPVFFGYWVGTRIAAPYFRHHTFVWVIQRGLWVSLAAIALMGLFVEIAPARWGMWGLILSMATYCIGFGMVGAPLSRLALSCVPHHLGSVAALLDFVVVGLAMGITYGVSLLHARSVGEFTLFLGAVVGVGYLTLRRSHHHWVQEVDSGDLAKSNASASSVES